jgi:diaminopimelate decarboxylase/aspartate kinase
MRSLLYKLSDVWATFGKERVHMISQSSNDLNLTFVIDEADADGLLPILHDELIGSGAMPVYEEQVFGPRWREIIGTIRPRQTPWWQAPQQRQKLLELAAQGTPAYIYDLDKVRERARQLNAISAIDRRFYAIKANSHPDILRTLAAEGFGLECVSQGEVELVFAAVPDLAPERVLFTPSFAPIGEYAAVLARGVNVTIDNVELLQHWPEVFRGRKLWVRIDLGHGDGHRYRERRPLAADGR